MNSDFWSQLTKPFVVIAPMADVTDPAFRQIIAKYSRMGSKDGGPAVMWTEFVSADGLCSPGRKTLERDLAYSETERPIVAQLFTAHPEKMEQAAALAAKLGFDGIDINMGCPDRSIEKQGAGAAHIKDPATAKEVIRAAKRGAGGLPVSVKTRVGYNKVEIDTWIPAILEEGIAALTIHARTRKEMSDVPARWEHVKEVVAIRDRMGLSTKIIGNGDVTSLEDAYAKIETSGADGAMVGRGIFGNPWFFDMTSPMRHALSADAKLSDPKVREYVAEKLRVMVEHTQLFEKLLGDYKNFAIMKKHYKAYVHGWEGSKELRLKLMETTSAAEVSVTVDNYLAAY
ncbi:MAG: tRNA-dihydrouridine synthase family protein [Candidatus Taylorbacteria bacterium]|nr:tRNA-dihydrouridine synthase family protein [Candidatus Taylorbacteria bacterium]